MIAADTSTWVAFLADSEGNDVRLLDRALGERQVVMAPVVLTELLSVPEFPADAAELISGIPMIAIDSGYWEKAGLLRAKIIGKGRKARLRVALIAQSCIDQEIPLLSRDRDFRAFAQAAALELF